MSKHLIVVAGTPDADATALAIANGCVGYYQGIPPVWQVLAQEQGWNLPCVVTEDDAGNVVSWAPVP
jgi:hypothetical protein